MNQQCRESCEVIKQQINEKLKAGDTGDIFPYLQAHMEIIKQDNELMTLWYLGKICERETENGRKTIYEKETSVQELLDRYLQLKFYLRRIENDLLDDPAAFYGFLNEKDVSEYELMGIIDSCVFNKEKVRAFFMA